MSRQRSLSEVIPVNPIRRSVWMVTVLFVVAGLVLSGCGGPPETKVEENPGRSVETVKVSRQTIQSTVSVTGAVKALDDVQLSAKMGGKVVRVPFREGDRVAKGAVVVQQDTSDYVNQVKSAEAALQSARVRLSQSYTTKQVDDVSRSTALRQAEAALKNAREQLAIVKTGARPQERRQAESSVASARSIYENAQSALNRTRKLFDQGAVAKAQLEAEQRAFDVARAQLDQAEEALSLVKEGARQEELRQAQNNVTTAEQNLRRARADMQQTDLRQQDIQAAQAGVKSAQASLSSAKQALADSSIKAPVSGVVAERAVEPGEVIGAGMNVLRIYNPRTVYFEATIPESNFGKVKVGQPVEVRSEGMAGRTFSGKVAEIYPAADTNSRAFNARISLEDPEAGLRPGMFGKAEIVLETRPNELVIPRECVLESAEGESVFLVQRGTVQVPDPKAEKPKKDEKPRMISKEADLAVKRDIETGLVSDGYVQALEGLKEGETIIIKGQGFLSSGDQVSVVTGKAESN